MRLATIEAIRSVYRRDAAGCCLHIVTDDANFENNSIDFVIQNLDPTHTDCREAIYGLSRMRITARKKAVANASIQDRISGR